MIHSCEMNDGERQWQEMSEIEWEPCLLTQRPAPELERRFQQETGRPGRLMRIFRGIGLDRRCDGARLDSNNDCRAHRSKSC